MVIWKYRFNITDEQYILMSGSAKILTAALQDDGCFIWAMCDPSAPNANRKIAIYGTGNPMPDEPGEYISTFQTNGGRGVWHMFDLGEDKEEQADHDKSRDELLAELSALDDDDL